MKVTVQPKITLYSGMSLVLPIIFQLIRRSSPILSTRPTSILNRDVGLIVLNVLCVFLLSIIFQINFIYRITRVVAYTLSVWTNPHIETPYASLCPVYSTCVDMVVYMAMCPSLHPPWPCSPPGLGLHRVDEITRATRSATSICIKQT